MTLSCCLGSSAMTPDIPLWIHRRSAKEVAAAPKDTEAGGHSFCADQGCGCWNEDVCGSYRASCVAHRESRVVQGWVEVAGSSAVAVESTGCVGGAARGLYCPPCVGDLCFAARLCSGHQAACAVGRDHGFCCGLGADFVPSDFSYSSRSPLRRHLQRLVLRFPRAAVVLGSPLCLCGADHLGPETLCGHSGGHLGCQFGNAAMRLGLALRKYPTAASCFLPGVGCVTGHEIASRRGYPGWHCRCP